MKGMNALSWLNMIVAQQTLTKKKFGEIMHDPDSTEAEKQEALRKMQDASGYENLPD